MKKNKTIEEIFHSLYDASEEAPEQAWNGLKDKLIDENIAFRLRDTADETAYLWTQIASKLRWLNFWHFSAMQFNIYYAGLLAIMATGLFFYLSAPKQSSMLTEHLNKSEQKALLIADTLQSKVQKRTTNKNASLQTSVSSKSALSQTTTSSLHAITYVKKEIHSSIVYSNEINKKLDSKVIAAEVPQADAKILQHSLVKDTMIVYDTVKVFDTIPVEPVVRNGLKNSYLNQPKWIASAFVMPSFFHYTLMSENLTETDIEKFKTIEKPENAFSFGLGIRRKLTNQFYLGTDIQYSSYRTVFQCEEIRTTIDTSTQIAVKTYQTQHILEKYEFTVDTVSRTPYVINVYENGHLVKTDTTWYYEVDTIASRRIYDTIVVWEKDTVVSQSVDTTKEIRQYLEYNTYSYLHIPVVGEYHITFNKLNLIFSGGVIADIFINAKGKGIWFSDAGYRVKSLKEYPFAKFNISLLAGTGISYRLDEHVSFMTQFVLMQNINNLYDSKFVINRKNTTFGLKIGINYLFY